VSGDPVLDPVLKSVDPVSKFLEVWTVCHYGFSKFFHLLKSEVKL